MRRDVGGEVGYLVDQGGEVLTRSGPHVRRGDPRAAIDDLGWEASLYAVLSLTVSRMLPVALATLETRARRRRRVPRLWFGRRGLASIVFAAILVEEAALPHQETLLLAVVETVGLSSTPMACRRFR